MGILIFSIYRIIEQNGGTAPLTYKRFQTVLASMEEPPPPVSPIDYTCLDGARTPVGDDHDELYGVPTLEELGKCHCHYRPQPKVTGR